MKKRFLYFISVIFLAFSCTAQELPKVKFLDENEARKEIINDSLSPYFSQLQPMEMSAKTGSQITGNTLEEMRAECRKRYQDGAKSFTNAEQEIIRQIISEIYPYLEKEYPKFAAVPWSFLKVSDNIEGGLPHTRDHHIILSENMCSVITDAIMDKTGFIALLLHEQFHVFQRLNPGFFNELYTKIWGFEKTKDIGTCDWLTVHHLANPDALDCNWVFPIKNGTNISYIQPLVVFSGGKGLRKMPKDFLMLGISLVKSDDGFSVQPQADKDGKPLSRELLSIREYVSIFGPLTTDIYHPEEASADIYSGIILFDYLHSAGKIPDGKYEKMDRFVGKLREWLKENTKK